MSDNFNQNQTFFSKSPSLIKFLNFLENSSGDFIDFQIVSNGKKNVIELLSPIVERNFIPIGEHGSQSLICYWKYQDEIPLNQSPIVWLDSEGSPNSVFALNIDDFLSLLPYDTGGIYDFISSWKYYNSEPQTYTCPLSKYDSSTLEFLLQLCKEDYADYDQFIDWLNHNLNIQVCKNPAKLVGDAINNCPNLDHWLKEKGIR